MTKFSFIMEEAHPFSRHNEAYLKNDSTCGCFSCVNIFSPEDIISYIDEVDGVRTAICPYCGKDTVIGEGSGRSITDEFLNGMNIYWVKSGYGTTLETPFGTVSLQLDNKDAEFHYRCMRPTFAYPDIDGIYSITYEYFPDNQEHTLRFFLTDCPVVGEIAPGERLETISFYKDGGKITLGCEASFGDYKDYGLTYDGTMCSNGMEIQIFSDTYHQYFEFGVT